MKKCLLFLFALMMICGYAIGQTYLTESFEGAWSGTPAAPIGWTSVDGTGATNKQWEKATYSAGTWTPTGGGTYKPAGAVDGSSVAHYNDYSATALQVDKLQTPLINLGSSTNPRLVFYYSYPYSSWSGSFKVYASNNGGTIWNLLNTYSFTGSVTTWTKISIPIPSLYKVSNAMFSFEVTAGYGNADLWFDNVVVDETPAPLTLTKTIKSSGGDYSTFTAAINALNEAGVGAGGVTFNVDANFISTEDCPTITATGTSGNPIVFQRFGTGANPLIKPTGGTGTSDAGIKIAGGDYITFDGIDITIATGSSVEYGYYIYNASATNGAQYNTIKNSKITLNRTNTSSIGVYQIYVTSPTSAAGANSYNKFYNLTIENAYNGIYLLGLSAYPDINTEIGTTGSGQTTIGAATANDIGNGSSTTYGIRAAQQSSMKIFSCEVRNVTGTSSSYNVYGIWLDGLKGTNAIYQNNVHDIKCTSTSNGSVITGIRADVASGVIANIYNNFVSAISSASTTSATTQYVRGIACNVGAGVGTVNVYYNSIRLDCSANISCTALYTQSGTMNAVDNVLANFSTTGATSKRYCFYVSSGTLTKSNYNDFYIITSGTGNNVGYYSSADRNTLGDWQTITSKDGNSKNVDPVFSTTTNLHSASSDLDGAGVTISTANGDALDITTDIDGATRSATPDIGADEFTLSTKVLGTLVYNQASIANVNIGTNNNPILRIDIPVTGSTGILNLNSLVVTSLNTNDADIAASGVKLYRTSTPTFGIVNPLGTAQSFSGGTVTFGSLGYDLPSGTTYVWVTYDIAPGATLGNTADAKILTNAININGSTYPASDQSPTGSRTIADDKGLASVTVTQASIAKAIKGSSNNETLLLDFNVTGLTGTLPLNSVAVTYTGTSSTDIPASGVKLYRTATNVFSTSTPLGSAVSLSGGIATFSTLAYDLPSGHTYVWVAFDVASTATTNNKVDAKIAVNGMNVNGNTYNSIEDNPAGNRNIFYTTYPLPFSEVFAGSTSSLPTDWSYLTTGFSQSTGSPYHGNNNTNGIFKNLWSSGTTANAITPLMGPITATSMLDFDYRIVDYTSYPTTATTLAILGTGNIKAEISTDGNSFSPALTIDNTNHVVSTNFVTKSVNLSAYSGQNVYIRFTATWGTSGDYYVDIDNVSVYSPITMSYVSSTTTQTNTNPVPRGLTNQEVIGIQVVTSGALLPLSITQFKLNPNGTSLLADISNARIWSTGTSSTFATTLLFGGPVAPSGTYTISGNQPLAAGTNYFWLTYDIPSGATQGDFIDAQCTQITVGGSFQVPLVADPGGTRQIYAPYAPLPYSQDFESTWINKNGLRDVPGLNWLNTPATGNTSWRRQDDGASASWSYLSGMVVPSGSSYAANFHTYGASSGSGYFDLYVDMSTVGDKILTFTYQNATGADQLDVYLSTNGGTSFGSALLSLVSGYTWAPQTVALGSSTSSTCVIRFKATSDYGDDDIGIDNLSVVVEEPMFYVSSTTTQNNAGNVAVGSNDQEIIGIQIVTTGTLLPINVSSFTLTNNSSYVGDITNARIYYTGSSSVFAATNLFGTQANPPANYSITGNQPLNSGNNYFWLAYDISGSAHIGAFADAQCNLITVAGNQTPTIQDPAGSRTIKGPLAGTKTVGATGADYTSLTGATGLFADINMLGLGGNLTVDIISDLSEDGTTALNQWNESGAGNYTLTIQPGEAVNKTISGSYTSGLIRLNGADWVTIDGSYSGSGKYLSFSNTNAGTSSAVIWLSSASVSNGATNNTIKNCYLSGNSSNTTLACIVSSSGTTIGGVAEAQNNNNTYQNNVIIKSFYGIAVVGPTGNETGVLITENTIGSPTLTDMIGLAGIGLYQQSGVISKNSISGVTTASTYTSSGILVTGSTSDITIKENTISNIKNTNAGGYGSNGIQLNSSSLTANVTVVNNMISDIASVGYSLAGVADNGYGIIAVTGGGYNIFFNSINLNTNQSSLTGLPSAINITSGITTAGSIDLRNNIFANTQTYGTNRYAIYCAAAATVFTKIDYNDYFTTATNLGYLGAIILDITAWRTATGKDAKSISANPMFVSPTNLHINTAVISPVNNTGIELESVLTDIDGDLRNNPPDIGADEFSRSGPKTVAPTLTACPGSLIVIPVKVNNFNNIGTISLTLDYDPAVLTFQNMASTTIPSTWEINDTASAGRFIIGGFGPGFSLSDGSDLFNLTFIYKGGISSLNWYDGDGSSCEYSDATTHDALIDQPQSDYYTNGAVSQSPDVKGLFLSLFLEGLYNGGHTMRKAQNEFGDQFKADTADVIKVELHSATTYSDPPVYFVAKVSLSTSGEAIVCIPAVYNGSYYVTIKHRNSIETTTAAPVSFFGATISYPFNKPSRAYGENLTVFDDFVAAIYAADENQDGIIDGTDLSEIANLVPTAPSGYIAQDVNGDGLIDGTDLSITGNNADAAINAMVP